MSNIIGLIPAGGQASRLQPLPFSKELIPIGFWQNEVGEKRPKVISHYLLEKYKSAGATQTFFIIKKGKWDIPNYYGDGSIFDMQIAYLMMGLPYGPPFTLDQAYPFVRDSCILLGLPDILFHPEDAFTQLLQQQATSQADLVLGLFPTADNIQRKKADMIRFDKDGTIADIIIKPPATDLTYTWIIACWTPIFTEFLHEQVAAATPRFIANPDHPELHLGDVFRAAIRDGMKVSYVKFPAGSYVDVGTAEKLEEAIRSRAET